MKKEILKFLVLLLVAIGAGPAYSALWQWSITASTNASIDPSINYAEGQAPSSLNDSARAMMARLAEWRQDISGANVLTGTSTAYVLSTTANQNNIGLCANSVALTDGQMIAFRANVTNGSAAQITVDNCSSLPLQSTAGTALPSGSIIAGSPYRASYNLANAAWVMEAIYGNPYGIPLGGLMPFTLTTVPNGNFVFPAGQCLSTTTYSTYWTSLGSPASGSCPGGQFQIIDLSGSLPAGLDTMPGFSAANRLTSSSTGCGTAMTSVGARCSNGNQSYTQQRSDLPNISISLNGTPQTVNLNQSGSLFNGFNIGPGTSGSGAAPVGGSIGQLTVSFTPSGTILLNGNVIQTPMPRVPPIIGVTYLLRVI